MFEKRFFQATPIPRFVRGVPQNPAAFALCLVLLRHQKGLDLVPGRFGAEHEATRLQSKRHPLSPTAPL